MLHLRKTACSGCMVACLWTTTRSEVVQVCLMATDDPAVPRLMTCMHLWHCVLMRTLCCTQLLFQVLQTSLLRPDQHLVSAP